MAESHFEHGLQQRAQIKEKDEDAERTTEEIQSRLEKSLEIIEEGFSPQNIESMKGAPSDVVAAASGESIEDLDLEKVAEYLATEKWNYPFNADISEGAAEIGVDDAYFNLWHDGDIKVTGTYHDVESVEPGITGLGDIYPDRSLGFDGVLYSVKPEEVQQKYRDAVQAKIGSLVNELVENPESVLNKLDIESDELDRVDLGNVEELIEVSNPVSLRYALDVQTGDDAGYRRLASEAQVLVVEDAFERLQDFGIEVDAGSDFNEFETYDELVGSVRRGGSLITDLGDPRNGASLRLTLYAEDGFGLHFDEASEAGYKLEAFDETGLETLAGFYRENR